MRIAICACSARFPTRKSRRGAGSNGNAVSRRAVLYELHESHAVAKLLERLNDAGIDTETFYSMDTPLYELVEGEGDKQSVLPLFSVPEILDKVLEIGSPGREYQAIQGPR